MGDICPFSIASGNPQICHPNCKFRDGNNCIIAQYLKSKTNNTDSFKV